MLSNDQVLIQTTDIVLVMSQLNCLSSEKYRLNCPNGNKCWSNERNLISKSGRSLL